jgi:hypothetical protein
MAKHSMKVKGKEIGPAEGLCSSAHNGWSAHERYHLHQD